MRVVEILFSPSAEDTDYYVDNGTGAGPFTQLQTATPDGLAHRVNITENSSVSQAGKTFLVVGTDADGKAISESIVGPGSTLTVESVRYFKTVASVTPSATLGTNTVDVGYVDEFVSKTVEVDTHVSAGHTIQVDVTGTINYTVQETADQVLKRNATVIWLGTITALATKTADAIGQATRGIAGLRLVANSYSTGATARMVIRPCGDEA